MQPNPYQTSPSVQPEQQQPLLIDQQNPYPMPAHSSSSVGAPLQYQKGPGPLDHLSDGLSGQARTAFIAKVYTLLTIELLITFGICLLSQYIQAYRNFQLDYPWVVIFPIILAIAAGVAACCLPQARQAPLDVILLAVFVLSFSYLMSMLCSAVVDDNSGPVVPMAVLATVGITLCLTVYAFLCKGNYVVWIGLILVCAAGALTFGIMSIFFYFPALIYVYCSLCIVIYGVYLVIITKMIVGGEFAQFPMDHPILASLFLYLYIMKIFMYILMMFGAKRR